MRTGRARGRCATRMHTTRTMHVVWIVVALTAASCGSAHAGDAAAAAPTTTARVSTTPDTANMPNFGKLYLAAVAPAYAAGRRLTVDIDKLPASSSAETTRLANEIADAFAAANQKLLTIAWPSSVALDVKVLVVRYSVLIADLRDIHLGADFAAWQRQFIDDARNAVDQERVVRGDVGLPRQA